MGTVQVAQFSNATHLWYSLVPAKFRADTVLQKAKKRVSRLRIGESRYGVEAEPKNALQSMDTLFIRVNRTTLINYGTISASLPGLAWHVIHRERSAGLLIEFS